MKSYSRRFLKYLAEQDEGLTDADAMSSELSEISPDDLGASGGAKEIASSITGREKQMYDELSSWIQRMDEFSKYLNGTENSIQTKLNSAESDTLFDKIGIAETKKIARVAVEVSSLSEMLKGYLASANDPKYKYV
jgi:hypothetical protein